MKSSGSEEIANTITATNIGYILFLRHLVIGY